MVQCINDLPRIRDKSDSFYRRQILVPMDKCFTGAERRYIKDDYLSRTDVLEYVLKKVLHTDFYELDIPKRCRDLLGMYKEINDPVREFITEFKERFTWDLIPTEFLYDLYKSWYFRCNPSGKPEGKTNFKKQLDAILLEPDFSPYWETTANAVSVGIKMSCPEPLIAQYDFSGSLILSVKPLPDAASSNLVLRALPTPKSCLTSFLIPVPASLSRFGRLSSMVGYYTDFYFPQNSIRFIAIIDDVDSDNGDNDFAPFKNIFNEWYARDTSRKIRETLKNKGENGGILCVRPIFGYKKDPDNKNHWLIDDEAAEVIRFIYDCCTKENMGTTMIANALRNNGVLTPRQYFLEKGLIKKI